MGKRQESKAKKGLSGVAKASSKAKRKKVATMVKVQAKEGRPTAYRPEYCKQAKAHCLLGATNDDLARLFSVATSTVDLWIKKHPEFSGAVKGGREEADNAVAKSLYRRALGYSHPEEVVFQFQGVPVRVATRKKYAPETTAMIFWLKNRRPDLWRDRVEHTGANGAPLPVPVIHVMPPSGDQST